MKINEPENVIIIPEKEYIDLLNCKAELEVLHSHISILNDYIKRGVLK